jgi:hypothetical protein
MQDHDIADVLLGEAHANLLRAEGMSEIDVQTAMDVFWFGDEAASPRETRETRVRFDPAPAAEGHWFEDENGRYSLPCRGTDGCFICALFKSKEEQS